MRSNYRLVALALLGFYTLSYANHVVTFPYVGYGIADDEWKDFEGRPVGSSADATTYHVQCRTEPCAGWENLPDFTYTMILGPHTFDFEYSGYGMSTHTGCTFTGSPTPTLVTCSMTNTHVVLTHSSGYERTFTVPGDTVYMDILQASLTVADGTSHAAPTATGSGSGVGEGRAGATATTTTTTDSSNGVARTAAPVVFAAGAALAAVGL